jgi:hypothetical protein
MGTMRYLKAFKSADNSIVYTLPLEEGEWESSQGVRLALEPVVGADYAFDHHGYGPAPVDVARETYRVTPMGTGSELDTMVAEARAKCRRIGLGKLFTVDEGGTVERWAWARVGSMPSYRVSSRDFLRTPIVFDFVRESDWFDTALTTGSQLCDTSPESFTINNPGDLPTAFVVLRLRANASGGFTNPTISNTTNGYSIATTRDSVSANSELRYDSERDTVEFSDNDGSSYTPDNDLVTRGAAQVGLFRLEPGNNSISVTMDGTPNSNLEWAFYAPRAF